MNITVPSQDGASTHRPQPLVYTMNMYSGSSSANGTTGEGMMIPYMHFLLGDAVIFKEWIPHGRGAMAGACVGLFFLAILERFSAGMRGVLEAKWKRETQARLAQLEAARSIASKSDAASSETSPQLALRSQRTLPPTMWEHDIPRGALYALQAMLAYALMLTVMVYNASFFIAIIVGLFVGEVAFGRFARMSDH